MHTEEALIQRDDRKPVANSLSNETITDLHALACLQEPVYYLHG